MCSNLGQDTRLDRELAEDDLLGIYPAHWQDPSWHAVLLLPASHAFLEDRAVNDQNSQAAG